MTTNTASRAFAHSLTSPREEFTAPELTVGLAFSPEEVRESQRLRYRIFAEELGAQIACNEPGVDADAFDPYCQHIIVRDQASREIVASTRVLLDSDARLAGGFYSESEFDLERLLRGAGRVMEIGRTCVHPDYRSGTAISLLWSGLARFIDVRSHQYLIGCASIPMDDGGRTALAAYELLQEKYLLPEALRVTPKRPLPRCVAITESVPARAQLPPLLKAYIRQGARIGGEPCWDPSFGCADLFIVLSPADLERRYARHFLER